MDSHKEKWQSRLTIWVMALLLFELISGLIIYLASFSLTSQALVILHTVLGLVLIVPYLLYQLRHWKIYRNNKLTQHKLIGYIAMVMAMTTALTGILDRKSVV